MKQITYQQALRLHERPIEDFGGIRGIRDESGLLAALARHYASFGGEDVLISQSVIGIYLLQIVANGHAVSVKLSKY